MYVRVFLQNDALFDEFDHRIAFYIGGGVGLLGFVALIQPFGLNSTVSHSNDEI